MIKKLCIFFTSFAFLHVARKTTQNFVTHQLIQLLGSLVVICRHLVNTTSSTTDDVPKHFCHLLKQFVAKVPILKLLFHANTTRNSRLLIVLQEQMKQGYQLDTAKLVELLQHYAVKFMTIYRQIVKGSSDSVLHPMPVDLEALYAYKRRDLFRCAQLSNTTIMAFFFSDHHVPGVHSADGQ